MNSPKSISISVRNNLYLNLLNLALFLIIAFTGSLIQEKYHMHGMPENHLIMGLDKSGWLLLHQASAAVFLAGIIAHCSLNWRFVSGTTRRIFQRKLSASLSYWLFVICVPTCLTAVVSWILFDLEHHARFMLIEIHDKLGWILTIFAVIHIISRAGRMIKAYHKLSQGRGKRLTGIRKSKGAACEEA